MKQLHSMTKAQSKLTAFSEQTLGTSPQQGLLVISPRLQKSVEQGTVLAVQGRRRVKEHQTRD